MTIITTKVDRRYGKRTRITKNCGGTRWRCTVMEKNKREKDKKRARETFARDDMPIWWWIHIDAKVFEILNDILGKQHFFHGQDQKINTVETDRKRHCVSQIESFGWDARTRLRKKWQFGEKKRTHLHIK